MSALWPSLLPFEEHGDDSRCAVSARGVRILFADGVERLCATSGLWNAPLGYGNDTIAEAISEAARRLSYGSVFRYENADARKAADALIDLASRDKFDRVLFSTGGGAANDLAMKVARQYHGIRNEPRRRLIVGLHGSFHGMTFGAFSLTGEQLGQEAYGIDRRLIRHIPPNDIEALEDFFARAGSQVAAMVVEPVSGSGTVPLSAEFVKAIGVARQKYGFLLVADEVATGFARTGPMFASDGWIIPPDMMILSKALTNGTLAAASVLVGKEIVDTFRHAGATLIHAETAAGTAVVCAAINATLSEMKRLNVAKLASKVGRSLECGLKELVASTSGVDAFNGPGAFRTVQVSDAEGRPIAAEEIPALVNAIRNEGTVVHPGVGGVQLIPALIYTHEQTTEALASVRRGVLSWQIQNSESVLL